MFCPQCGQERVSVATNYCSRCGFLLTGTTALLQTGGAVPAPFSRNPSQQLSPRKRGLKQGLFLFLLTFLAAPLMGMISLALRIEPFGVGIAVVLCFIGGLLRMVYALMFESAEPGAPTLEDKLFAGTPAFQDQPQQQGLPEPAVSYVGYVSPATGNWRDTNDLQPISVTENTTKLLERDDSNQ